MIPPDSGTPTWHQDLTPQLTPTRAGYSSPAGDADEAEGPTTIAESLATDESGLHNNSDTSST